MMFQSSSLFLAFASFGVVQAQNLTFPTTEALKLTSEYSVDEKTCEYTLTFVFEHDATLPLPSGPADCNPAAPAIAADGLPFLAERHHYYALDTSIQEATPFDHVSLDFQSCGHPPLGVFTKPHYDFHVYTASVAARETRTCEMVTGAPICVFAVPQPTAPGQAFFEPIPGDALGHEIGNDTAIPFSGIHSWNFGAQPATADEWLEPVFVTGGYGNTLAFWEPMLPIDFVTGPDDHVYEETIVYNNGTDAGLPTFYTAVYNATSGKTTLTLMQGLASNCTPNQTSQASHQAFHGVVLAVTTLMATVVAFVSLW